jgi:hypothetical protein
VNARAAPEHQGPVLWEGFHSLYAFVWSSGAIVKAMLTLTVAHQFLLACIARMSEGRERMQRLPRAPKGSSIAPAAFILRLVEWRDRKSMLTLTRTTNQSFL